MVTPAKDFIAVAGEFACFDQEANAVACSEEPAGIHEQHLVSTA